jgi:hypothetical protein
MLLAWTDGGVQGANVEKVTLVELALYEEPPHDWRIKTS